MTEQLDFEGLFTDDPGLMHTYTGRRIDPLAMTASDVCIEDIAHALSRLCRYNGHVGHFLSVARHSIWVATQVRVAGGDDNQVLAGLLHDAAEAYLGDLIRPLKQGHFGQFYCSAEEWVEAAISDKFAVDLSDPAVKAADNVVLMEVEMPQGGARWTHEGDPVLDRSDFLDLFDKLTDSVDEPIEAPVIVGLSGYARAGKDTAAEVLIEQYGFERIAFADAMRDMLYAINPLARRQHAGVWTESVATVQHWVDSNGWDWAKGNTQVRDYLQRLGTEGGRNVLGDDIWVRVAMAKVKPGGRYVFTDVRFPNEADAIEEMGGQMWRVERPGTAPVNLHPSETALDGRKMAERIHNAGVDIGAFHRLVDSIAFHKLGLTGLSHVE